MDDNEDAEIAQAHRLLCVDRTRNRDIWGIIVYSSGQPKARYRVGWFVCWS